MLPLDTLVKLVGGLTLNIKVKIPGILVIDTPGHEAFFNLRKRGGSIADFAILVIDITAGVMPQTVESIEILKSRKTPFVIAANKVDLIKGWLEQNTLSITASLQKQQNSVRRELEAKIYQIIGKLSELGVNSDLFMNIRDFRKTVPIVPVSAKTGEGISELIAVIIGMSQSFLTDELTIKSDVGKGVVLEVLEEPGLGTTMNIILYDGRVHVNDTIVVGGVSGPIVTKLRAILMPKPLDEMRDPREKFKSIDVAEAVVGAKFVASEIDGVVAGAPLISVKSDEELREAITSIEQEINAVRFLRETQGVVVKADTLGSLEALINELERRNIKVHLGDVGDVSRRDVVEASSATDPLNRVILAFYVRVLPEARGSATELGVRIFEERIIYRLIEGYLSWKEEQTRLKLQQKLDQLILPGKLQVLPKFVFRRSKPAIVGVVVVSGLIKPGYRLISSKGKLLGPVQQIQSEGQPVSVAEVGKEVAISMPEAVFGRDFEEGEFLYVDVPSSHILALRELKEHLPSGSFEVLGELLDLRRKWLAKSP